MDGLWMRWDDDVVVLNVNQLYKNKQWFSNIFRENL